MTRVTFLHQQWANVLLEKLVVRRRELGAATSPGTSNVSSAAKPAFQQATQATTNVATRGKFMVIAQRKIGGNRRNRF